MRFPDDTCVIYDARTGRESTEYSERFGEEIFGIDVNGFERTLYLSERNLSPAPDPDSISARLSSLAGTDMDIDAVETARRVLDDQRRFYVKKPIVQITKENVYVLQMLELLKNS